MSDDIPEYEGQWAGISARSDPHYDGKAGLMERFREWVAR